MATSSRSSKSKRTAEQSPDKLRSMHRAILLPRMIEEKMLLLLRQGRVSKWFSGIGQEAISVGSTLALTPDEYILPLHRNLGVFTTRDIPLWKLIAQWQGKETGFTTGRDRSFHFDTRDYRIVGMISHLGPQLCVADGLALASTLRGEKKVTLVYSGDGGTSQGDFHEALNIASVWNLPVIFLVENNGYALSTPTDDQFRCRSLSERAAGYGMEGVTIDGNDVLEVYNTVSQVAGAMREAPRPVLVECMTFRMRGHEEASGVKYVPPELLEKWAQRDPIVKFEKLLLEHGVMSRTDLDDVREELSSYIEQSVERAFAEAEVIPSVSKELADVYAPSSSACGAPDSSPRRKIRFIDAISDALKMGMRRHSDLVLMGQDIAGYGGVFKVTEGLLAEFGPERVRNTPLCESAILGSALGLSIEGMRSMVEMQFADFVSSGFNQIVNNLAKSHYRWGQAVNVVVRMPTGAGSGAGPFHSQSNEAWFVHTPGLKVVYPSTPEDAKGLLLAAFADPNPVMFFEHKALYRSVSGDVPEGYYETPIGKARLVRDGARAVVITYGAGVHWAERYLSQHPELDVAVLDLRTLLPLDYEGIEAAVRRCSRVLVLHEDTVIGGLGGEVAAYVSQHLFSYLDAPVVRVGSLDTPVPFASQLEQQFLPVGRFEEALRELLAY